VANSIRTPRQGKSDTSKRIAKAVDDEEWQEFRLSLKGKVTSEKLAMLQDYYEKNGTSYFSREEHTIASPIDSDPVHSDCDICIRLDNYIKALCRGGQLYSGESLESMIRCGWNPDIKS
jgi:hypothetical protein